MSAFYAYGVCLGPISSLLTMCLELVCSCLRLRAASRETQRIAVDFMCDAIETELYTHGSTYDRIPGVWKQL